MTGSPTTNSPHAVQRSATAPHMVAGGPVSVATSRSSTHVDRVRSFSRRTIDAIVETPRNISKFGTKFYFFVMVLLPTLVSGLYFIFIAAGQYSSEARFVVHTPGQTTLGGLSSLLKTTSFSASGEPAYSVVDYIRSRDALRHIEKVANFREVVSRPEADFLTRFPNLFESDRFEDLYDRYPSFVEAYFDSTTNISTIRVKAFRAEDAAKVASALLDSSEALVNRMNSRSRRDALEAAERDVKNVQDRISDLQLQLIEFRIREGILDPQSPSKSIIDILGGISKELVTTKTHLAELQASSPLSPSIGPLRNKLIALTNQYNIEKAKVIGEDGHIARSLAQYEKLMLDMEFQAKSLTVANSALEAARSDSARKQLYLERVVEPNRADAARYPKRLLMTLSVFVACFILFSVVWLLVANVREHRS